MSTATRTTAQRVAERFADQILCRLGHYDQLGATRGGYSPTEVLRESVARGLQAEVAAAVPTERRATLRALIVEAVLSPAVFADAPEDEVPGWTGVRLEGFLRAEADYGCDDATRWLMVRAGVPPSLFPIKSRFQVLREYPNRDDPPTPEGIAVASGYGAPTVYHYPLAGDGERWMLTDFLVCGKDRVALCKLAADGVTCEAWKVVGDPLAAACFTCTVVHAPGPCPAPSRYGRDSE